MRHILDAELGFPAVEVEDGNDGSVDLVQYEAAIDESGAEIPGAPPVINMVRLGPSQFRQFLALAVEVLL